VPTVAHLDDLLDLPELGGDLGGGGGGGEAL
jgi:hypothetical protein